MVSLSSLITSAKKGAAAATTKAKTAAGLVTKGKAATVAVDLITKGQEAAVGSALTAAGVDPTIQASINTLAKSSGGLSGLLTSVKTFFTVSIPNGIHSVLIWQYNGLTLNPLSTTFQVIMVYLPIVLLLIGLAAYFAITRGWFKNKKSKITEVETVASTLNAATSNAPSTVTEGFVDAPQPMSADESSLINLQPLTIKHAGFMGQDTFDPQNGPAQALRAGFRSFIFQIDYLDKTLDSTKFAAPGIPTLIYRGDDGSLLSTNSADINAVANTIANLAFRPDVPNYDKPVIIYLHILRTPSALADPDGYIGFLSKIATALNPLAPKHLGMTPMGPFNRQKQESVLINTPIHSLEGQIIILCNADTTMFRSSKKKINPADDLDFWVNMRVYLNSDTDSFGITQIPAAGVIPHAIIVKLSELLGLSGQKQEAFALRTKHQFIIAMPSATKNPTATELGTAINTLGVNMLPLDIFSDSLDTVKGLVSTYSNMPFRPMPAALRSVA